VETENEQVLKIVMMGTKMTTRGARMIARETFQAGLALGARVHQPILVQLLVGTQEW